MRDCLQIFRIAPGRPRDYFRHQKIEGRSYGEENLHFSGGGVEGRWL